MNYKFIKAIRFNKYKRFSNQSINFCQEINAIAGTNGTCKSSLLHIISNSYKECTSSMLKSEDSKCLKILSSILNSTNPKIESLNRLDMNHNDPAPGITPYYTCEYDDNTETSFRKHNSKITNRYSVKPYYKNGTHEKLNNAMIAYLGINRLSPFGEYLDETSLSKIRKELPDKYKSEIANLYREFTTYEISGLFAQKMGIVKNRIGFTTNQSGIDSNTISAGEDNLLIIITTLICLKYFRESLSEKYIDTPIILLIDEFDATLHPEYQIKLADKLRQYSKEYAIQVVFTTHSISLLSYMLKSKMNVIYILDNVQSLDVVKNLDQYKIEQYLKNELASKIYIDRNIPIFSEDEEARDFINVLFDQNQDDSFLKIKNHFHLVNIHMGADSLITIFSGDDVTKNSMHSICILDGDHTSNVRYSIVALPNGNNNFCPEQIAFEHAIELYKSVDDNSETFWDEATLSTTITKNIFKPIF